MQLLKYSGREPGHYPTEKMIDPFFYERYVLVKGKTPNFDEKSFNIFQTLAFSVVAFLLITRNKWRLFPKKVLKKRSNLSVTP